MSRSADIIITVLSRLGGKGISLMVFLVLARQLSLEEFGIYGYIFSVALILAAMFDLGVRNALAYFIGKGGSANGHYTVTAKILFVPLSILSIIAFYPVAVFGTSAFFGLNLYVPSAIYLASSVYVRMIQGAVIGAGEIKLFNLSEAVGRSILALLTLATWGFGVLDLQSALWSMAISQIGSVVLLARRTGGLLPAVSGFDRSVATSLVKRGSVFMLGVMMMHASKRLSFLILTTLGTPQEAGYFFGLLRLSEIITEIGLAISVVALSHSVRSTDAIASSKATAQLMRLSLFLFMLLGAILIIFAEQLVPIALGPEFSGDMDVFRLIVVGTLIGSVWTVLFPSLATMISPAKILLIFVPGVIANLILSWLLFINFGLMGSAISIIVVNALLSAGFLIAYRASFNTPICSFLILQWSDLTALLNGRIGSKIKRIFERFRK